MSTDSITKPTREEMSFIADINLRRDVLKGQPLVIEGRIFSEEIRLNQFELENTKFLNCDFVGCTMLQGMLRNVSFENCAFVANIWDKGRWDDVSFLGCAWRGRFNMGPSEGKGKLRFDDCEFIGLTSKEMGYGGPADTFGAIGGTKGDVFYNNCRFAHTYINGGASLHIKSSILDDSRIFAGTGARLLMEDITGSGFVVVEGGQDIFFSSVIVRDSKFSGPLILKDVGIGTGTFERIVADLNLKIVRADTINIHDVTFFSPDSPNPQFRYGLHTQSARIGSLNIVDCNFRGPSSTLNLWGEAEYRLDQKDADGNDVFTTEMATAIEKLTIHHTNLIDARLQYMRVGNFRLEELAIKNADFSHSKINVLALRQVTMDGKVEFSDTVITRKQYVAVTDRSTGTPPSVGK